MSHVGFFYEKTVRNDKKNDEYIKNDTYFVVF